MRKTRGAIMRTANLRRGESCQGALAVLMPLSPTPFPRIVECREVCQGRATLDSTEEVYDRPATQLHRDHTLGHLRPTFAILGARLFHGSKLGFSPNGFGCVSASMTLDEVC